MSNTESSAITRLINEAHGPVIEPFRSNPAPMPSPAAAAQRIARGTIAPHQPLPAPAPQAQLRPTQEQAWYDAGDADIDELIEDADQDDGVPVSVTPEARAATPWQDRAPTNDPTPLPRVLVQNDDSHADRLGMARLPAPRAQAPEPQRRVSAQIVAPLPSPAPFGTPAPERRVQAAPSVSASSSTLSVESMSYWEGNQKPRRTFLWIGLACALVGAGFVGYTMLRPKLAPATATESTPAAAPAVAPAAVAAPVPAVEAKEAPAPAAEVAAAAPAPESLTAGFTLPGIPVDTRVVFDGKQLGIGPMKVQRLAPGPHKLQLIAAGGATQDIDVDLTADAITPLSVPAAAEAAPAEAAAAETAPQVEPAAPAEAPKAAPAVAETPRAAKRGDKKDASPPAHEKASPKARAHASRDEDSDADADEDVKPKKPAAAAASAAKSKDMGTLLVNAKPPCEIIVDGKKTGLSTPQRDLALSPGAHTIVLVNAENHIKKSSKIKITAGKPTRLVVDLTDQMDE